MKKERDTAKPAFSGEISNDLPCREQRVPTDHDSAEDPELHRLHESIRLMPDLPPPDVLLRSVMHSVRTQRLPMWTRLMRWARSPCSITFTPLRAAPLAAAVIGICFALAYQVSYKEKVPLAVLERRVPVVLTLRSPEAKSVSVIGSFNGWQAQACEPQAFDGETHWTVTLSLPSGRYEYAFVVDGERIVPDPGAGLHEEDGFGNQNAVLFIGNGNGNSI